MYQFGFPSNHFGKVNLKWMNKRMIQLPHITQNHQWEGKIQDLIQQFKIRFYQRISYLSSHRKYHQIIDAMISRQPQV